MLRSPPPRSWAALTTLALVAPLSATLGTTTTGQAAPVGERKPAYAATVERTKHGIPHITGKNFGDLGFGSGYATSETSLCTLVDTVLTARGERSRWFGPKQRYDDQVTLEASNLQVDAFVTDLRNLASSIHRLNDAINIAAACRDLSRHPDRVLPLVT